MSLDYLNFYVCRPGVRAVRFLDLTMYVQSAIVDVGVNGIVRVRVGVLVELWGVLMASFETLSLFLLISMTPWVMGYTVRYFKGKAHIASRALIWSAFLASAIALAGLMTLPPPTAVSPLAVWLVTYLYGFVPIWLTLALIIVCVLLIWPKPVDEDEDG